MRILSVGKGRTVPVLLLTLPNEEEGERRLSLTQAEYLALGSPVAGDVLSPELAEQALAYDEYHRAVSAAVRILSFGDNNPACLLRKLRVRGFSSSAAERAVSRMVERGYIREADQLERAVLAAARKLWGARRITEALVARGFDRRATVLCIERLVAAGEIDFAASRARLLAERIPHDAPPQKKRAFLYRYGYGGGEE